MLKKRCIEEGLYDLQGVIDHVINAGCVKDEGFNFDGEGDMYKNLVSFEMTYIPYDEECLDEMTCSQIFYELGIEPPDELSEQFEYHRIFRERLEE